MRYVAPFGQPDPDAPYVNGNPGTGVEGSIPPAAAIEHAQREIVAAIVGSGQTPDAGNLTQLWQAITGAFSKATNGYLKLPSGIVLQWGTATVPSDAGATTSSVAVTFPTAFPTAARSLVATPTRGANVANGYTPTTGVSSLTSTGCNIFIDTLTGSSGSPITITQSVPCVWFAIGY